MNARPRLQVRPFFEDTCASWNFLRTWAVEKHLEFLASDPDDAALVLSGPAANPSIGFLKSTTSRYRYTATKSYAPFIFRVQSKPSLRVKDWKPIERRAQECSVFSRGSGRGEPESCARPIDHHHNAAFQLQQPHRGALGT